MIKPQEALLCVARNCNPCGRKTIDLFVREALHDYCGCSRSGNVREFLGDTRVYRGEDVQIALLKVVIRLFDEEMTPQEIRRAVQESLPDYESS